MPADPHELAVRPGSARSVSGRNAGQRANLRLPRHYPVEAVCRVCGGPVRRETMTPAVYDWIHLARKEPG